MQVSKGTTAYRDCRENRKRLLEGVVVAIDPSVGSHSSMPGYAVYRNCELITSGVFDINPDWELFRRLRRLAYCMRKLLDEYPADVLVYEEIAPRRYGGGSAHSHASLLKAVGVVLSISGTDGVVGLRPPVWKKLTRPTYRKGDEADAIEMGWIAIEIARGIPERKTRRRNTNDTEGTNTGEDVGDQG